MLRFTKLVLMLLFALTVASCGPDEALVAEAETPPTAEAETPSTAEEDCCNCAFFSTKTFEGNDTFQCSFAYPAHWEVRFIPMDNTVEARPPRCEQRCDGARQMIVSIATGKDNNADYQEREWEKSANIVGSRFCGGRKVTFIRPPGTEPDGKGGALVFHVGDNDGRAYDAQALFSCPNAGEWQRLERLVLDSLDDRRS
jgi:hypothetical protein